DAAALARARRGGNRGRAAPVLRRHDAGQGPPDPQPCAATPLARPAAHARAIAVLARHRSRVGETSADAAIAPQAAGPPAQIALDAVDLEGARGAAVRSRA